MTSNFAAKRRDNISRNKALLEELGAVAQAQVVKESARESSQRAREPAAKKRRIDKNSRAAQAPTRTSARIASAPSQPKYNQDGGDSSWERPPSRPTKAAKTGHGKALARQKRTQQVGVQVEAETETEADVNTDELRASWASWTPVAPPPTRDDTGVLHFESHPDFTPNKSPSEVLREGAFGGSYFRPLHSKKLGITVADDWRELPAAWIEGLDVERFLASETYDADANKFKVACGQSIEQWEASGWINHRWDVRGWFQWYCRFFAGRRCDDDDRQVSRWKKCVGGTGRWRRMLLKKYVASGVRTVWDDGEDEDAPEVSPVMHQTCHHWAFEVTQDVLDEHYRTGT